MPNGNPLSPFCDATEHGREISVCKIRDRKTSALPCLPNLVAGMFSDLTNTDFASNGNRSLLHVPREDHVCGSA